MHQQLKRHQGANPADTGAANLGATRNLLLVEDNPGDACLVEALLDESSTTRFVVQHATRLRQALALLATDDYDLILLDLSLPDAHGLATVRRLKTVAGDVPIVVQTGTDDETLALEALKEGAQDYIVKGQIDGRSLARTILHAVERNRMLIDLEAAKKRQQFLATHDSLTQLPNRQLFLDRLSQALTFAERYQQSLAVLFLDLDHFKAINDAYGHAVGDRVLLGAADRLQSCIRDSDTAARLGGDEFTLLLQNLTRPHDAAIVARQVIRRLAEPHEFDFGELSAQASIGIAVCPHDGTDPETLIRNADAALYHVKRHRRGSHEFFTSELGRESRQSTEIRSRLREALQKEQLRLHYQPQVDVRSGAIVGAEALVRWEHPELGRLGPAEFIPAAEEVGLIEQIGEWVLRTACRQHLAWRREGRGELGLAVNFARSQLRQRGLTDRVQEILGSAGMQAELLQIEVTETGIMADCERSGQTLSQLKELGAKISIDDFGTGHSSLSCLRQLPIDILKIDRSFVHDLMSRPSSATLIDAIVSMAKSLRIEVIAEGVETTEQRRFLESRDCYLMQGFLFGRPVPPKQFAESLTEVSSLC